MRFGFKSGALGRGIVGPAGQSTQGSGDTTSGDDNRFHHGVAVVPGDRQSVPAVAQASGDYEIVWYQQESPLAEAAHLLG
ncbi:MAG: hypothetical protein MUQ10_13135 [Anaerolineae bacterium]|nr:hypothetical protein [Anaerolineae bacterium]